MARILALQLKRIGDLVLTAPALALLRRERPADFIAVAVWGANVGLLPLIPGLNGGIAFGKGRGWTPWQQTLTGGFDTVLDFTGNDRSAAATVLSRGRLRATFDWARKSWPRALAWNEFVDSPVRGFHTVDHYLDLLSPVLGWDVVDEEKVRLADGQTVAPTLEVDEKTRTETAELCASLGVDSARYALIHPGTARVEKYWEPDRWAEVIAHLHAEHGLACLLTGGADVYEKAHIGAIEGRLKRMGLGTAGGSPSRPAYHRLDGKISLPVLAALAASARVLVSCDTGVVHMGAAFGTPQVALFGPTNPYHWRPRHPRAVVISAAWPDRPMTDFRPRMKGAPMDRISTGLVIRATDSLL